MFERILIANRGEVAARVARTCRRLGVETVGVHVTREEDSVHVEACDESICLGDDPRVYRDAQTLVEAAAKAGARAVHPGYGLLADEPDFAQAIEEKGLIFVGPAAERFEHARNRMAVRQVAIDAGVRVLPAGTTPILEPNDALAEVDAVGYPVVVKPVRGVGEPARLPVAPDVAALHEALEGLAPLSDHAGAYLERWVDRARHVEVQLVFDGTEALVLGDREVSLRKGDRRVLCESPAPALDQLHHHDAVRGALWDASVEITRTLGCRGLASCHFLLDADGVFHFVHFTPSLQVEHPTAEMCAGVDLVEMQLRLAAGEAMPEELWHVESTGASLQARVDASMDPATGRPFESRVELARWPPAPQGKVRIETGIKMGSRVDPAHAPLVATVSTYAPNRHDALLMLDRILAEIHLHPLVTNLRLLRKALNHESLQAGQYDDGFVDRL
ncbi:MAG TPA: biotin carboxylase N-terminal domain-containing protein [Sandaracinaceae bacterium LLY-WYZ-13_1]|nr:biotin carboxylase N-terminal domain-containing protein [Sandaracinaceae bacterium LLY-WYZ-13_1]